MRQTVPMRSTIYVFQVHMHDQPRTQQLTVAIPDVALSTVMNISTIYFMSRRIPIHIKYRIESAVIVTKNWW